MDKPTPRVNQSLLSKYQGQAVRLVGKVKSVPCLFHEAN